DVKVDDDGQELPPTLSIVATETGEGDLEKTRIATQKLLKDNPDVRFIFATNQTTTRGVCLAIDEFDMADEVDVIGFDSFTAKDGAKSSDEYIESGVLDGFILQNPYNMGYLGIRYARNLINGQTIATNIDTGATLVTKDNINDSDIKLIMHPMDY
ncbi:MAG: substrate-binding domain-containing protein, partial [Ruminococcus sp.]|nr:substrate-binding domain-containing protein [Ruminococcus sp.]